MGHLKFKYVYIYIYLFLKFNYFLISNFLTTLFEKG
jgi:hypothetical protein